VARLVLSSYVNRSSPEKYLNEETQFGPLVWDGVTPGLHRVREAVLKAPDDTVNVTWQHRTAQRGEVDICINFKFEGEIPPAFREAVRATVYAVMSLLNLKLQDFLTPTAPFQIRKVLPGGNGIIESGVWIAVHNRHAPAKEVLTETLAGIAGFLTNSQQNEKHRVALELYAAHFNEQQTRVRFLLLVIAMESLAMPTKKHGVAISLLERWQQELSKEMPRYDSSSEEFKSLEALSREIKFREEDSIRSQIRKLFVSINGIGPTESDQLQRRALHVYDKRSTLVHDGHLPDDELLTLETEARELLERLFMSAIEQPRARSAETVQVNDCKSPVSS
jgi:hypothetical protein